MVHRGVKFSCRFTVQELQQRWYALLYDTIVSRVAVAAMRNLHPEVTQAVQAKALFSKAEEELLGTIKSVSGVIFFLAPFILLLLSINKCLWLLSIQIKYHTLDTYKFRISDIISICHNYGRASREEPTDLLPSSHSKVLTHTLDTDETVSSLTWSNRYVFLLSIMSKFEYFDQYKLKFDEELLSMKPKCWIIPSFFSSKFTTGRARLELFWCRRVNKWCWAGWPSRRSTWAGTSNCRQVAISVKQNYSIFFFVHADVFLYWKVLIFFRRAKKEIRTLENELGRWQVLVDSVTGINPPEFDNQTLAVLRGRLVRYLMRSKEVQSPQSTWIISYIVFTISNDQGFFFSFPPICLLDHTRPFYKRPQCWCRFVLGGSSMESFQTARNNSSEKQWRLLHFQWRQETNPCWWQTNTAREQI